jgi:cytoskeletal protein RodZ
MVTPPKASECDMTLAARIRLSLILAAGLMALAAAALAGNPPTPNTCDETQAVKSRSNSDNSSASATRRETSISPTDDGYVPLSRTAPVTAPAALHPTEPVSPVTVSPRVEKPAAHKAEAATAASRSKRTAPTPPRAKVSIPNLPATPGMGTLLRVGITAGREIS